MDHCSKVLHLEDDTCDVFHLCQQPTFPHRESTPALLWQPCHLAAALTAVPNVSSHPDIPEMHKWTHTEKADRQLVSSWSPPPSSWWTPTCQHCTVCFNLGSVVRKIKPFTTSNSSVAKATWSWRLFPCFLNKLISNPLHGISEMVTHHKAHPMVANEVATLKELHTRSCQAHD